MLSIKINGKIYSKIFKRVELSGEIKGTSRILRVEFLKKAMQIDLGDKVEFFSDDNMLFTGKVFDRSINTEELTEHFTAYDNSIYLNKNYFIKNYTDSKPSEILKEICGELRLEVGVFPEDKVKCTFPMINRTGYEIILSAYTIQHNKDKKIYSVVCNNGKIDVVNEDAVLDIILNSEKDIRNSKYSENIKNMVNQIIVYKTDELPQTREKVSNEEDKKKFGLFQKIIQYHDDMNNIFDSREMLKGKEQTATISVNGNINLQSGYTIGVNEPNSKLIGSFIIQSDKHIWTGDMDYETILELGFERIMDKVEFDEFKRKYQYSVVKGKDSEVVK